MPSQHTLDLLSIIGIGPVSGPTPQRFKKRDRLQGPIPVYSLNRVVTVRLYSRKADTTRIWRVLYNKTHNWVV